VGRHEPGSVESGLALQGLRWGSARRRLTVGSYVCGWSRARLGTMSASMSITFMRPDFLTKFLEEYRELPVLWQVCSADFSNTANSTLPKPGGRGPSIYIPRDRVTRLYPQPLGSLFVAFYASQGYSGVILFDPLA
jgi:hypothetical protein